MLSGYLWCLNPWAARLGGMAGGTPEAWASCPIRCQASSAQAAATADLISPACLLISVLSCPCLLLTSSVSTTLCSAQPCGITRL